MCAEAILAVILALAALNAERIYQKEQSDVRRYNLEICSRELAGNSGDHCAASNGLPCKSFRNVAIPGQSAKSQAHEAARDKAP